MTKIQPKVGYYSDIERWQAKKIAIEQLSPEFLSHSSWRMGLKDKRVDTDFLASYQFENIFLIRENNLLDILGIFNDDGELDRIKSAINRIIELSKPK